MIICCQVLSFLIAWNTNNINITNFFIIGYISSYKLRKTKQDILQNAYEVNYQHACHLNV